VQAIPILHQPAVQLVALAMLIKEGDQGPEEVAQLTGIGFMG